MRFTAVSFLGLLLLSLSLRLSAQPLVDLQLTRSGNTLVVSLLPGGTFDGLVSNAQWTLSWTGPGPDPGSLSQANGPAVWLPVEKAGPVVQAQGRYHQVFVGVGLQSLAATGDSWTAGAEVPILTLTAAAPPDNVLLVAGAAGAVANGQAYVELDGLDRTGLVREGGWPVARDEGPAVDALRLFPNPNTGHFFLTFSLPQAQKGTLRLLDMLGREQWTDTWQGEAGQQTIELRLPALPGGIYGLQVLPDEGAMLTCKVWIE
jgi:hypothetical protein